VVPLIGFFFSISKEKEQASMLALKNLWQINQISRTYLLLEVMIMCTNGGKMQVELLGLLSSSLLKNTAFGLDYIAPVY